MKAVTRLSYQCIQSDSLHSSSFTTLQSVYRVLNNLVRIGLLGLFSVSVDVSLATVALVFLLELIVSRNYLTVVLSAVVVLVKLYAAVFLGVPLVSPAYTQVDTVTKKPFTFFGLEGVFDPQKPTAPFSLLSVNLLVPFLVFLLSAYSFVSHVYTATTRRYLFFPLLIHSSVFQALKSLSTPLQLSVRSAPSINDSFASSSCGSSLSPLLSPAPQMLSLPSSLPSLSSSQSFTFSAVSQSPWSLFSAALPSSPPVPATSSHLQPSSA